MTNDKTSSQEQEIKQMVDEAQEKQSRIARNLFICDKHDTSPEARDNCGACALKGYHARGSDGPKDKPNYAGWARDYVQARMSIPKKFQRAFIQELNSDNRHYVKALLRDIEYFGVHLD